MSNHSYASVSAAGGGAVGVVLPPNPHLPQPATSVAQRRNLQRHHFVVELSQCLFDFVVQLLPTPEELAIKEDVRKLLERLIRNIEPESRLLSFGSTANGFALRNSDMDLCCLIDSEQAPPSASELVVMVGDLLERETKFEVKPLPKARIPIIKLSLAPTQGLPCGIACDIGFENRLALENTRLLLSYATVDPTRVRTMVLFLKVWSKRRKINSPYLGTLSSYGYALLVIFFLIHVKNPPVLPNLQAIPPLRPISHDDMHIGEHNIWFFDDTELLKQQWQSTNTESVGELLVDFFRYYSHDFPYNHGVLSIRAGLLDKAQKGWFEPDPRGHDLSRDRNRLCIEDPFETSYNVGRTVTKDGLYTIRGEFMRAARLVTGRIDRAYMALSQLCEEREEELVRAPTPQNHGFNNNNNGSSSANNNAHVGSFAAQSPYTVGTHFWRPNGPTDRLSPPPNPSTNRVLEQPEEQVAAVPPPHMAPKRQRWTSPPPPDAPAFEQNMYKKHLGIGISLATSSVNAREGVDALAAAAAAASSSGNSSVGLGGDEAGSPSMGAEAAGGEGRWGRQGSFGQENAVDQQQRVPRTNRVSPTAGTPTPGSKQQQQQQQQQQTAWRGRPPTRPSDPPTPAHVPSNPPPSSYAGKVSGNAGAAGSGGAGAGPGAGGQGGGQDMRRSFSGPPAVRMPAVGMAGVIPGTNHANASSNKNERPFAPAVTIPTQRSPTHPLSPPPPPLPPVLIPTHTQRSPTHAYPYPSHEREGDGEVSPSSMSSGGSSPVSARRAGMGLGLGGLRPMAFPLYQSQGMGGVGAGAGGMSPPLGMGVGEGHGVGREGGGANGVGNGNGRAGGGGGGEEGLVRGMEGLELGGGRGRENGVGGKERERERERER